jgi:uncharacterized membrane protein YjgN (DUF898 family)
MVFFAEKRSREDEVEHLLQITVNSADLHAGSFGAVLFLSLLTVEVVSYRVAAGHSSRLFWTVVAVAAAYTTKRHRCRSPSRRFCRNRCGHCDLQFLGFYLVRMTSILSLLSLVAVLSYQRMFKLVYTRDVSRLRST